ncbi:MAG: hypothetical protein RhofKO_40280 [Rhodothermales bacterium]
MLPVSACQAQDPVPALGNRAISLVASLSEAEFYSDFWLSFHDYLYGRAREPEQVTEVGAACLATLPKTERAAWQAAVAFYEAELSDRHHRLDPLTRAIRRRLAEVTPEYEPQADTALALLTAAASAYKACLWETHNAQNRARIAELLHSIVTHGPALRRRLEQTYQADWPSGLIVDVTPYAAFANTSGGPGQIPHTMLSSTHPNLERWSGLEIFFHEGSHSMFGGRHGEVARALRAASIETGIERPRDLWHATSFHTSGRFVQEMAAAAGDEYTPYYLRRGIFPDFVSILEAHWNPYLDGKVTMEEAASAVVRALGTPVND